MDPLLSNAKRRMVLLEAVSTKFSMFRIEIDELRIRPPPPGVNSLRDPNPNTNQDKSTSCCKPSVSRDKSFVIRVVQNFHETNLKNRSDIVPYAVIL